MAERRSVEDDHQFDAASLMQMMQESERSRTLADMQEKESKGDRSLKRKDTQKSIKAPSKSEDSAAYRRREKSDEEIIAEEEVRLANMESRLRCVIIEMLRPTIAKSTKLHTDHEMMVNKFQEMIKGHQNVLNAQKEAKEHSEMVHMFKTKLDDFWQHSNELEDRISQNHKTSVAKFEETEQALELNKSNTGRLARNFDKALQDMDRIHTEIKTMQVSLEKGIQKNKERMEAEMRTLHMAIQDIREMHQTLALEVVGHEDCDEISPPSLRRLDMQMKRRTRLLDEAIHDIHNLQKLDKQIFKIADRQSEADDELKDLIQKTRELSIRVEACAEEAKSDFKKASNLMAAFSANLVREARQNFKDELKHAQQMQQGVDEFVRQTQFSVSEMDEHLKSICRQLEASMREVRTDLDIVENKRKQDKQGVEDQVRHLTGRVGNMNDLSEQLLRGLEHVSGVINMSLQSERMSVALDLQDYLERKDTPYVGLRDNLAEARRTVRSADGVRRPPVEIESLQRITYAPKPVSYQGTSFERSQLITLREKLVHGAQETLRHGPDTKRKLPGEAWADSPHSGMPHHVFSSITGEGTSRCGSSSSAVRPDSRPQRPDSRQQRPGSRNQPSARGSPLLEGELGSARDWQWSSDVKPGSLQQSETGTKDAQPSSRAAVMAGSNATSAVGTHGGTTGSVAAHAPNAGGKETPADGVQLPSLSSVDGRHARSRHPENKTLDMAVMPSPLTSR